MTFSSALTSGNLITIATSFDLGAGTTNSVTDDLSASAINCGSTTGGNFAQNTSLWYYKNYGGGNRTITLNTPNGTGNLARSIVGQELSGADPNNPLIGTASGAVSTPGSSTTPDSTALSPATTVDGTYYWGRTEGQNTISAVSPASEVRQEPITAGDVEDYIQPTASSISLTWSQPSGGAYQALAASFAPASNSFVAGPKLYAGFHPRLKVRGPIGMIMRQLLRPATLVTTTNQTLTPNAVTSTWAVAAPTLVKGAVLELPNAIVSTWATATPTVVKGVVTELPSAAGSTWSVATPSLLKGGVTKTPSAVTSTWSIATPTVGSGGAPQTETPSAVGSTWAVAAPTVVKGAVIKTPAGVTSTWSVATPSVNRGPLTLATGAVGSNWAIAAPAVLRGPRTLLPNALVSTWSVTTPALIKGTRVLLPSATVSFWGAVPPTISGGSGGPPVVHWLYMGHRPHRTGIRPNDKDIY